MRDVVDCANHGVKEGWDGWGCGGDGRGAAWCGVRHSERKVRVTVTVAVMYSTVCSLALLPPIADRFHPHPSRAAETRNQQGDLCKARIGRPQYIPTHTPGLSQ